jgi:YegS/Rv2252/BmrU family lipid kinase
MSDQQIHIVFNPASAGGKTGNNKSRILTELKNQLGNNFAFSETRMKTDATIITREAINNGCHIVVAVGGDGTINEVVNGFFENGTLINPDAKLGIISFGTGQGFAQSIGLPKDLTVQIKVIKSDIAKSIDVGRIKFKDNHLTKYFVNEFQFGIGGTLNKNISARTKKILGKYAFGFEAVKTLLTYQADSFQMIINDKVITESIIGVIIANGAYTGGGMRLTPKALLYDGILDVLLIKDMSLLNRLFSFSRIYSAKHLDLKAFELFKTRKIEFIYKNGLAVEADGELINGKCTSVEIMPSVLKVISNN